MPPSGKGKRKILIVGDAPTELDDSAGEHAQGNLGRMLEDALARYGVNMRRDCMITNALICHPVERDKKHLSKAIDYCRPNLIKTVQDYKPESILLFGSNAVRSLISHTWKEAPGSLERWVGFNVPDQKLNTWISPLYNPAILEWEKNEVLKLAFEQQLERALSLEGRPWTIVPDWESTIEIVDPDEAALIIDEWEKLGGEFALDFENNCLKPETEGGQIVCCSICYAGRRTISFVWHGAAIAAVGRLIASKRCGFIASNLKHEERWCKRFFGYGVRRWIWDTMIGAHVLDNREGGICSLKFQAYVWLGMPSYDDHIKQFLKSQADGKINRIKESVDLRQLLKYCGFDTLLEFKLAKKQCRKLAERNAITTDN